MFNNQFVRLLMTMLAVVLLAGCGIKHPQTAEEFRKAVPGAFMGEVESFEVSRSFRAVANTFEKRASKCLNVRIKTVSQTNTSYQVIVTKYTPTVIVTKERAELHVQQHHEQGVMKVSEMPEKGYYLIVADATPVDKNRTRIDLYRPSMGHDVMVKAIKGWATGKSKGCPNLAKN
jgi:hypothetical protein